ncbi:MAG: ABC transporter ATP-binding protein [Sphingomonadales bacterium]
MTSQILKTPTAAIEVTGLDKVYAGGKKAVETHALKSVDLTIPKGSLFALLGPNGAGKSTFINILAGLVKKTGGVAKIWGFDIEKEPRGAASSLGVVTQEITFDPFFTPREMLDLQAGLYGVPKSERITMDLLQMVRLEDKADAYSRTLSGGMKRRLMVAKAMVHSPPILILDEPTAGVDVELRHELWENVKNLHRQGVTIVLTTHYLEEAEELCDTIAIINHGEVIACEPKTELLKRIDERQVRIDLKNPLKKLPKVFEAFGASLENPKTITLQISKEGDGMGQIFNALRQANLEVHDFTSSETDLEDVFIQLTKKSA